MWKKNIRSKILIILVFIGSIPLQGQERVDLSTLVQGVLEENYQVQIIKNRETIAQNNNTLGNAGFLPSVTLSGEQLLRVENSRTDFYTGETRTGSNARSTSLNAMVEVNWMVFDGMKMFARRERLGHLEKLGQLATKYYIEQTAADLGKAYYRLVKDLHLLTAYEATMRISAFRLKLQKQKRDAGASGTLEYNQARVDYHTDSALVTDKFMQIRNLKIDIKKMINGKLDAPLRIATDSLEPLGIADNAVLIDSAVAANSQLKQARIKALIADAERKIEQGDMYPEVSLFGRYAFSRQTSESGFVEAGQSYGPAFGINVRFNLFNGGQERTAIRNAGIEQENARLNKTDIRQMIKASVLKNANTYHGLYTQYRITRQSLKAARQSLAIARKQLAGGAINGYDFRQTQERLIKTRIRVVELKYQMKVVYLDIQRLTGRLLDHLL